MMAVQKYEVYEEQRQEIIHSMPNFMVVYDSSGIAQLAWESLDVKINGQANPTITFDQHRFISITSV